MNANGNKMITLLAIETSCDETGIAVVRKNKQQIEVLADSVSSQVNIHRLTGGVIPEVAAREHVSVIKPMLKDVLSRSGVKTEDLEGIAVTFGPGLIPALAVGVAMAKTLAYAWGKPLVPVHHIEGHIVSALLLPVNEEISNFEFQISKNNFPALALIVSGGHTLLIKVNGNLSYEIIGTTRDDAAGEAFDKVARLLELPYPGGPHLSSLAEKGNAEIFNFPRPMLDSGDFDFSFSGLKTAVLYAIRELPKNELESKKADIAAGFEQAAVDSLVLKTKQAIGVHNPEVVLLAGGVAANKRLRQQLQAMTDDIGVELRVAPLKLCGDNAVMIGQAGVIAYEKGRKADWREVDAVARPSLLGNSV